jgi:hypothetical protein
MDGSIGATLQVTYKIMVLDLAQGPTIIIMIQAKPFPLLAQTLPP